MSKLSALRKLAAHYADIALTCEIDSIEKGHIVRVLREIAQTPYIAWKNTRACSHGISQRLRDNFPVPGYGVDFPVGFPILPNTHENAAPLDVGDYWYRYAAVGDVAQLYGLLKEFCLAIYVAERKKRRGSADGVNDDFTSLVRRGFGIRRLCQFCWRPAGSGRGEKCCHVHSMVKNPAGYMFARRHGLQTPPEVALAFESGRLSISTYDPVFKKLISILDAFKENFSAVAAGSDGGGFLEDLRGVGALSKTEHKNWAAFVRDFRNCTNAGNIPDDPRYLFLVLPHAVNELEEQHKRDAERREPATNMVLSLARKADKSKRGWQTEIAKTTGLSRQRVSKILSPSRPPFLS